MAAALALACAAQAQANVHPGKLKGSQVSAVQVEIFSDYECPACKTMHEQVERQMIRDFADTGKILIIYRDFPLPQHRYSRQAAKWANAAARMGRFSRVADALFESQESWARSGNVEKAATQGMTPAEAAKLKSLLASPELDADIERDLKLGRSVPVTQTPTLVIRHKGRSYPLAGVSNYNLLRRFLEQLLSK